MIPILLRIGALLVLSTITSCINPDIYGSGNIISEKRDVATFNNISFNGSGNVFITQDTAQSLRIETDDNIMSLLETDVNDNTLEIDFQSHHQVNATKLNIYISMAALKTFSLNGSGDMKNSDTIKTDNLSLKITGSGKITMCALAASVASEISGSGDITISGKTDDESCKITGSGNIKAFELYSKNAQIEIIGSGDCRITASEFLNAKINGSGDIYYKGKPAITKNISGSGSIVHSNFVQRKILCQKTFLFPISPWSNMSWENYPKK
jgi:hypothetical protein